jgi:hypothetical protein
MILPVPRSRSCSSLRSAGRFAGGFFEGRGGVPPDLRGVFLVPTEYPCGRGVRGSLLMDLR